MSYTGLDPRVNSEILTDQGVSAVVAPASGSHKIINRNGSLFVVNSSGSETPVGASGSGEKTYVSNPSAQSATTGWAVSGAGITLARTTTLAELPREFTTPTGFKITNVSGTDYVYYRFSMDDADKAKKLKAQLALKPVSGYAANDMFIAMYTNSASDYSGTYTKLLLTTDASGVSGLPNYEGTYVTSFDTTAADIYYELRIGRTTATSAIVISDVLIGPGSFVQGAVISAWTSYTPTGSWVSNTTYTGRYRRLGDSIEVDIQANITGAVTATEFTASIPSGITINTAIMTSTDGNKTCGTASCIAATNYYAGSLWVNTNTTFKASMMLKLASNTHNLQNINATNPDTFASGDRVFLRGIVPISEWAGAGTVNLGQNDVEYASVESSFTDTSASGTIYGTGGTPFSSTALTATRTKTITWQSPIQTTDTVVVEFKTASGQWVPFNAKAPYSKQNTTEYGVSWENTSSTQTTVTFGQYVASTGSTFGSAGSAWSSFSSTSAWRARKLAGGQAIGFAGASTTASGLVNTTTQSFAGDKSFASGHVGIGDTNPSGFGISITGTAADNSNRINLNSFDGTANSNPVYQLSRQGTTKWYMYNLNTSSDQFILQTASLFAITIDQATATVMVGGQSTVVSGGAHFQTADGVTFPATQVSSSNAKTLDDYEEGSWTPGIGGVGGPPSGVSYSVRAGFYTKTGRVVTMTGQVVGTISGKGTGQVCVNGFPFAGRTLPGTTGNAEIMTASTIAYAPLSTGLVYQPSTNATQVSGYILTSGGAPAALDWSNATLSGANFSYNFTLNFLTN